MGSVGSGVEALKRSESGVEVDPCTPCALNRSIRSNERGRQTLAGGFRNGNGRASNCQAYAKRKVKVACRA